MIDYRTADARTTFARARQEPRVLGPDPAVS
jgi:hypothetical protein